MSLGYNLEVSEEGERRRRAEYLILKTLEQEESVPIEVLDNIINRIADNLVTQTRQAPVYFKSGGSNGAYSRELNEAIDRCLHLDWIEQTPDGKYTITNKGSNYIQDDERLRKYQINNIFRQQVQETLQAF